MANIYGLLLLIFGTFFAFMFKRAVNETVNPIARIDLWHMVWSAVAMAFFGFLLLFFRFFIDLVIRAYRNRKRERE